MAGRKRKAGAQQAERLEQPTPEQLAKGGFTRDFITHVETATKATAYRAAHDPVERWEAAGRMSDNQMIAIGLVRRLWRLTGLSQIVTANYGTRIPGAGNVEARAATEIDARHDLHRIQDYIPLTYWNVFENVVRHGEPAGVAGSRLGFGDRTSSERAHTIVCFVADVIAMKERL
jgi:hypothetical protein